MSDATDFEPMPVVTEGREGLTFSCLMARDGRPVPLPAEEPTLPDAIFFLPPGVFRAGEGAVVFSVAARPAVTRLAFRNFRPGDDILEPVFLLKGCARPNTVRGARVAADSATLSFALNAAEVVLASIEEISAKTARPDGRQR